MANQITVTACDNELIVLAYQADASFELCRILSGNSRSVNVTLHIQTDTYVGPTVLNGVNQALNVTLYPTLKKGDYSILLLGVNWGGLTEFMVDVNGKKYELAKQPLPDGLQFKPDPIKITVI